MSPTRRRRGLTLIEVLIAAGILAIVVTGVTRVWLSSDRSFRVGSAIAQAQAEARMTMTRIEREVRAGSRDSLDWNPNELTFSTLRPNATQLTSVAYRLQGTDLVRTADGTSHVVARDISAFKVDGSGQKWVSVELTVTVQGLTSHLYTQVGFRNP